MAVVFDPCLRRLMAQTIYVSAMTGANGYGDPSYAAAVAAKARVEPKVRTFYSASGEELQSQYVVYTEALVRLQDRLWRPGENQLDPTKADVPMQVYQGIDEDGAVSHYEVYI